jgi:hypothetical protein
MLASRSFSRPAAFTCSPSNQGWGSIDDARDTLDQAKIAAVELLERGFHAVVVKDETGKIVWKP